MKDPLQIGVTPYEILDIDQYADKKIIQKAFMMKLRGKTGKKATQARKTLLSPIKRAYIDIFMFSPNYLHNLLPKIREPKHLLGKRKDVASIWNKSEINEFPSIKASHSLAVLWYWWARYITESERIEKTDTITTIQSVQDLATDYSLQQLWENTIARWIMLLNSNEFLSNFEFTKNLDETEKERLKLDIYQHFIGLFAEYSHNYQKVGLKKESQDFTHFSLMFKSESEVAHLLGKTQGILPQGYSCGRLYLENVNMIKKVYSLFQDKEKHSLKKDELDGLKLLLSDEFHQIPILFSEKQYSACEQAIRNALKAKGISSSPKRWAKSMELFPLNEQKQLLIVIKYYAKTCFHLGKEYSNAGDFDKTLEMFSLAAKMSSKSVKSADISDAFIEFLDTKAGHNADLELFYLDKILKLFKYNKIYDHKAEILKEKATNLSQKLVNKLNKLESPSRDELIPIVQSYRVVILLDEQAIASAKTADAIKAAKSKLVDDLLKNHLVMTDAIVGNGAKQLNEVVANIKKQLGNTFVPALSVQMAINRLIESPNIKSALQSLNVYTEKNQMAFLHALYEMRYCTVLLKKYAFKEGDAAFLGGVKVLREMGLNQIGGKDIDDMLGNNKLFKYNDEAYWIKSTDNFIMFTDITNSNIRYDVYKQYREGDYSGALKSYKKSFSTGYGVSKFEFNFYKKAESDAKVNELYEKVIYIEQSAYQMSAGVTIAIDALDLHKKIKSSGKVRGVDKETQNEHLKRLESVITNILKKQLENETQTKQELKSLVDLAQRIYSDKIKIDNIGSIVEECAIKLFELSVNDLNVISKKTQSAIEKYLLSKSRKVSNTIIEDIFIIEENYLDIEKLVKKYSLDEQILNRCKLIKKQVAELTDKYYNAYAQKCYGYIEKIISKSDISDSEIEIIDNEARLCKKVIDDYCEISIFWDSEHLFAISKNLEQIIEYQDLEYYIQTLDTRKLYNKAIKAFLSKEYLVAIEEFKEILESAKGEKFTELVVGYISDCYLAILLISTDDAEVTLDESIAHIHTIGNCDHSKIEVAANEFHQKMEIVSIQRKLALQYSNKSKLTLYKLKKYKENSKNLQKKYNDSVLILSQIKEYNIYTSLNYMIDNNDYSNAIKEYEKYIATMKSKYTLIVALYVKLLSKATVDNIIELNKKSNKYEDTRIAYEKKHQLEILSKIRTTMKIYDSTTGCFTFIGLATLLCFVVGSRTGVFGAIIALISLMIVYAFVFTGKCGYKGCKFKVDSKKENAHKLEYEKDGKAKTMDIYLCPMHMEEFKNSRMKMPIPDELLLQKGIITQYIDEIARVKRSYDINKYKTSINLVIDKYLVS